MVGRTSLRNQYIHKRFSNAYKATIGNQRGKNMKGKECQEVDVLWSDTNMTFCFIMLGADFITKEVVREDGKKIILQLWDTAGQERFQSLGVAYYRGADACVLVYDVNNFLSFQHIGHWRDEFLKQSSLPQEEAAHFPMMMIGNKIDMNDRVVSRRQAKAWAEEHSSDRMQIGCFEASAKEGTNVEKAFRYLANVKIPQLELDMTTPDGDAFALTSDGNHRSSRSPSTGGGRCC